MGKQLRQKDFKRCSANIEMDRLMKKFVKVEENKLKIEKPNNFESDLSLKELCADYKDDYDFKEVDWGEPIGKEIW